MTFSKYLVFTIVFQLIACALSQGVFNFAKTSSGERQGDLSPAEIAVICAGAIAFLGGLAVTVFFCYHVYKKQTAHMSVFDTTKHSPLTTYVE